MVHAHICRDRQYTQHKQQHNQLFHQEADQMTYSLHSIRPTQTQKCRMAFTRLQMFIVNFKPCLVINVGAHLQTLYISALQSENMLLLFQHKQCKNNNKIIISKQIHKQYSR